MLPEVKAGCLIRKRIHNPPKLQDIDPSFGVEFDEAKHGKVLKEWMNISHLSIFQQNILTAVIKKYWRVFSKEGVTTPVKDYVCEIDTGNAKPIRLSNVNRVKHLLDVAYKCKGIFSETDQDTKQVVQ